MSFNDALADRLRMSLKKRKVVFNEKRMMGGICFMVCDKMCLGVSDDRLMVRLDPDVYEACLKRKGCKPMDFTGRPLKGFVFVLPEGHGSQQQLDYWLDLALEFNPRAKLSKKRVSGARKRDD